MKICINPKIYIGERTKEDEYLRFARTRRKKK